MRGFVLIEQIARKRQNADVTEGCSLFRDGHVSFENLRKVFNPSSIAVIGASEEADRNRAAEV